MANIGTLTAALGVDISGLSKAEKAMRGFLGRTKTAFKAISPFLGFTIAAGIAIGLKNLTAQAVLFEKEMSNVKAIAGATADEFARLGDTAKSLGETTIFTAKEAAEGMSFLAMAGFETNEIIGAMPGVLELASAATLDLGTAADITSNILQGYGKEVSELGHVNDVLVKAFTSANVNLSMLGQSMKFVGPVAKLAGVAFEETAAAVALLGNAGIQGTMAGSALRNAISRLLGPTPKATKVLKNLGIEVKTASGGFVGISDVVGQFEKALDKVGGEAERTAILMEIFGLRAGPAMAALIEQGGATMADFTKILKEVGGIAGEIADEKIKNLAGSWAILKSAMTGVFIYISETGFPILSKLFLILAKEVVIIKDLWDVFKAFPVALFEQFVKVDEQIVKTASSAEKLKDGIAIDPLELTDFNAWSMWGKNILSILGHVLTSIGGFVGLALETVGKAIGAVAFQLTSLWNLITGVITFNKELIIKSYGDITAAGGEFVKDLGIDFKQYTTTVNTSFDKMIAKMESRIRGVDLKIKADISVTEFLKKIEDKVKAFEDLAEKLRKEKEGEKAYIALMTQRYSQLLQIGDAVWQSLLTSEEAYRLKVAQLNDLLAQNVISQDTYARAVMKSHEQMIRSSDTLTNQIKVGIMDWSTTLSSALADALVTGELSFKQLAQSFARMIAQMIIQARLVQPMFAALTGIGVAPTAAPAGGGTGVTGGGATTLAAHGLAFNNGKALQAFARGGIVNSPTLFPLAKGAGLMGEAGPEGILPLSRTKSGDLGVNAEGIGGGGVQVNIFNNTDSNVEVNEASDGRSIDVMIDGIVASKLVNGKSAKVLRNVYNLKPTVPGR